MKLSVNDCFMDTMISIEFWGMRPKKGLATPIFGITMAESGHSSHRDNFWRSDRMLMKLSENDFCIETTNSTEFGGVRPRRKGWPRPYLALPWPRAAIVVSQSDNFWRSDRILMKLSGNDFCIETINSNEFGGVRPKKGLATPIFGITMAENGHSRQRDNFWRSDR